MGPGRNRFWLPLLRLSAVFGAVVVGGNLLLNGIRPSVEVDPEPGRTIDYFTRKKGRIQKHIRAFERLLIDGLSDATPAPPASLPAKEGTVLTAAPAAVACGEPPAGVQVEEWQEADPPPIAGGVAFAGGLPLTLAYLEPDPPAFSWPQTLAAPTPREIDLPRIEGRFPLAGMTPELAAAWYRSCAPDPISDVGDALLRGPEFLLDGVLGLAGRLIGRSGSFDWRPNDTEGITSRLFDFEPGPRSDRIFSDFMGHLAEREQRFFSRFEESYLETFSVEDREAAVDMNGLLYEQGKVVWDALKKTYFSKYKFKSEERIRDEAFYFNEWRGIDFVVLPPLIAGYVYYHGLEKRVSIGETVLKISFEPLSRWLSTDHDIVAGASLEWSIKGSPLGIIVSAGLTDGKFGMDFIGIGTSVGMVKKALTIHRED